MNDSTKVVSIGLAKILRDLGVAQELVPGDLYYITDMQTMVNGRRFFLSEDEDLPQYPYAKALRAEQMIEIIAGSTLCSVHIMRGSKTWYVNVPEVWSAEAITLPEALGRLLIELIEKNLIVI